MYHKIFTISNKEPDAGEIKELKKVIEELTKERNDDVPLLWFKIKEDLKKTKEKWLNWEQVKRIAAAGGLHNEKTLQAALQFFHGAGDMVYFNDIKDFIVLDPQWLIKQLSEVITIPSFGGDGRMQRGATCHWTELETNSLLREDICKVVWAENTIEGLVAIMMKYALLLPMPNDSNKGKVYLVPSLLPLKSQCGEKEGTQSEERASLLRPLKSPEGQKKVTQSEENVRLPVRIVPPDEFIPVGLTSRLITTLINEHHWEYKGPLYKDAATLNVEKSDQGPQVSITQVKDAIEIRCTKRWDDAGKRLQKSLVTIKSMLETLINKQTSKLQIQCKGCKKWFEVKDLSEIANKADCPKCNCQFDQSPYSIWAEVS